MNTDDPPIARHSLVTGLRCATLLLLIVSTRPGSIWAADPPKPPEAKKPPAAGAEWKDLFDGSSLDGWQIVKFGGAGEVEVKDGNLLLGMGAMLTGVIYTNPVPKIDYEVSFEAKRLMGSDFFCALTVPVNTTNCTLVVGGWGGGIVGISSLDGYDASENDTTKYLSFEMDRWYRFRLRVTKTKIEAWKDDEKIINTSLVDRSVGMRAGEIEMCVPLGFATWQTAGAIRAVRIRPVSGPDQPPK